MNKYAGNLYGQEANGDLITFAGCLANVCGGDNSDCFVNGCKSNNVSCDWIHGCWEKIK